MKNTRVLDQERRLQEYRALDFKNTDLETSRPQSFRRQER